MSELASTEPKPDLVTAVNELYGDLPSAEIQEAYSSLAERLAANQGGPLLIISRQFVETWRPESLFDADIKDELEHRAAMAGFEYIEHVALGITRGELYFNESQCSVEMETAPHLFGLANPRVGGHDAVMEAAYGTPVIFNVRPREKLGMPAAEYAAILADRWYDGEVAKYNPENGLFESTLPKTEILIGTEIGQWAEGSPFASGKLMHRIVNAYVSAYSEKLFENADRSLGSEKLNRPIRTKVAELIETNLSAELRRQEQLTKDLKNIKNRVGYWEKAAEIYGLDLEA